MVHQGGRRRPRPKPRPPTRALSVAPEAQRVPSTPVPSLLAQLQWAAGNRAVSQLVELQRAVTVTPATLSSTAYVAKFAAQIARDLMAEMTTYTAPTGSEFASWKPLGSSLFVHRALTPFKEAGEQLPQLLFDTLGFWPVKRAVNRGRVKQTWTRPKGPSTYQNAVALELRRLVSARIAESMAYLGPRYVAARNQVALRDEARSRIGAGRPSQPPPTWSRPIHSTSI